MVENPVLQDILIYQMLSYTLAEYIDNPHFLKRFALKFAAKQIFGFRKQPEEK